MELRGPVGAAHGVVPPVRVDPEGLRGPTKRQAAGPEWRRSSRGLYVPAHVELTTAQRIVEAGVLVPEHAAVTGWAALYWLGGSWFTGLAGDGRTPVRVPIASSRHRIRGQPLIALCEERWNPNDLLVVDGIAVTTAVRSVWFAMRYAGTFDRAVSVLDMAAFDDLTSVAEVRAFAHRHPSYTGIGQCRDAVELADENAWSPMEVEMRQAWVATGRPTPLTNRPVFDPHGNHLGTPDLLDPAAGVYGEYEGALHLTGAARARDLRREELLRAHGLEGVTMVAEDRRDLAGFHHRLRGAYARASAHDPSARAWTLRRPDWWPATFTVEQRRALDEEQRAVWLRRRAA